MKFVRLYYLFQFFFSMLLWIPIYYEYQKRLGLPDQQIFQIQSIYYIFFCFVEIPTGMLADIWGRRRCMSLGSLLLIGANLLPVFLPSYYGILSHFLAIALSRSFISGAASAYLYDQLEEKKNYKMVEGRARSFNLWGKVIAWPAMGPLMAWWLPSPYLITTFCAVVALGVSFALPKEKREKSNQSNGPWKLLREVGPVIASIWKFPWLILIVFQGLVVFVMDRICQTNLFQPILKAQGFRLETFGFILSVLTVFEALGSDGSALRWMLKRVTELQAALLLTLIMAASLAWLSVAGPVDTLFALGLFSLATGLAFPVQGQLLNDAISRSGDLARYRATVLSIQSILDRAVTAWVISHLGHFVAQGEMKEYLWGSAIGASVSVGLLALVSRPVKWLVKLPRKGE